MARVLICPKCRTLITDDTRSRKHDGCFHAFLGYCFQSWPAESTFHPKDKEQLRSWCLWRTGHTATPMTWNFSSERERKALVPFVAAMMLHFARMGVYVWAQENDASIELVQAESINWERVGERKFMEISEDVTAFIKEFAGIDFQTWKEMETQRRRDVA